MKINDLESALKELREKYNLTGNEEIAVPVPPRVIKPGEDCRDIAGVEYVHVLNPSVRIVLKS